MVVGESLGYCISHCRTFHIPMGTGDDNYCYKCRHWWLNGANFRSTWNWPEKNRPPRSRFGWNCPTIPASPRPTTTTPRRTPPTRSRRWRRISSSLRMCGNRSDGGCAGERSAWASSRIWCEKWGRPAQVKMTLINLKLVSTFPFTIRKYWKLYQHVAFS